MRGHNSFPIIITPKDSKQAFKKAETSIQRGRKLDLKGISQHFMLKSVPCSSLDFYSQSYSPLISNLFILCPTPSPPCWDWTQAFKKAENKDSKRQKTGPEEIAAGADREVLSLDHQQGGVGYSSTH